MSRKCQLTGRGPRVGNNVSHAHNVNKRRFLINLQKVRVVIDGKVQHIRVSTKAIKSGLIERPSFTYKPSKPKQYEVSAMESAAAKKAAVTAEEESVGQFFSTGSVVSKIFTKKRTKPGNPRKMTGEQEEMLDFEFNDTSGRTVGWDDTIDGESTDNSVDLDAPSNKTDDSIDE